MIRGTMHRNVKITGFTLLEVMVAVAILSISLMVLMNISGNTLVMSGRSEMMTVATMLAQKKMTEIELELKRGMKLNEFPDEKSEEGKFDDPYEDFSWAVEIKKVELPAPVTGEKGSIQEMIGRNLTKEISNTIRELKVTVKWEELGEQESIDVTTHIVKI